MTAFWPSPTFRSPHSACGPHFTRTHINRHRCRRVWCSGRKRGKIRRRGEQTEKKPYDNSRLRLSMLQACCDHLYPSAGLSRPPGKDERLCCRHMQSFCPPVIYTFRPRSHHTDLSCLLHLRGEAVQTSRRLLGRIKCKKRGLLRPMFA